MPGSRPLTWKEIHRIATFLEGPRDTCLFWLILGTGLRISEVCSVTADDVLEQNGTIKSHLTIRPKKQGLRIQTRKIPFARSLLFYLNELLLVLPNLNPYTYIFQSRKGDNTHISARHARRILSKAFIQADCLSGCSPHSLRKSFAQSIYENTEENIFLTQQALGHMSPSSTVYYLNTQQARVDAAIKDVLDSHLLDATLPEEETAKPTLDPTATGSESPCSKQPIRQGE